MAFAPTGYFQKAPTRDSNHLVKPFMQVAIHTTRYYATLSKLLLFDLMLYKAVNNFLLTLYVSIQIGLSHHDFYNLFRVWRTVSEDSRKILVFPADCPYSLNFYWLIPSIKDLIGVSRIQPNFYSIIIEPPN